MELDTSALLSRLYLEGAFAQAAYDEQLRRVCGPDSEFSFFPAEDNKWSVLIESPMGAGLELSAHTIGTVLQSNSEPIIYGWQWLYIPANCPPALADPTPFVIEELALRAIRSLNANMPLFFVPQEESPQHNKKEPPLPQADQRFTAIALDALPTDGQLSTRSTVISGLAELTYSDLVPQTSENLIFAAQAYAHSVYSEATLTNTTVTFSDGTQLETASPAHITNTALTYQDVWADAALLSAEQQLYLRSNYPQAQPRFDLKQSKLIINDPSTASVLTVFNPTLIAIINDDDQWRWSYDEPRVSEWKVTQPANALRTFAFDYGIEEFLSGLGSENISGTSALDNGFAVAPKPVLNQWNHMTVPLQALGPRTYGVFLFNSPMLTLPDLSRAALEATLSQEPHFATNQRALLSYSKQRKFALMEDPANPNIAMLSLPSAEQLTVPLLPPQ